MRVTWPPESSHYSKGEICKNSEAMLGQKEAQDIILGIPE